MNDTSTTRYLINGQPVGEDRFVELHSSLAESGVGWYCRELSLPNGLSGGETGCEMLGPMGEIYLFTQLNRPKECVNSLQNKSGNAETVDLEISRGNSETGNEDPLQLADDVFAQP